MEAWLDELTALFEQHRDEEVAKPMQAYMKSHFSFLGIKAPNRRSLTKPFLKEVRHLPAEEFRLLVKRLWELQEREYQYVALDALIKQKNQLVESDIDLIETLITTKSWWDTVDLIASHLVGALFEKEPHLLTTYGEKWLHSGNIWLQRSMIIFQLKYKEKTDEALLFSTIRRLKHIDEFFIQKAIGWALREYSKTKPEVVESFIEQEPLSNLSKREGLKVILKSSNK